MDFGSNSFWVIVQIEGVNPGCSLPLNINSFLPIQSNPNPNPNPSSRERLPKEAPNGCLNGENYTTSTTAERCGRNCFCKSCLLPHGLQLPVYRFSEMDGDNYLDFLDRLLKEWDERKLRGLFHHDITACESKILPGKYGYVLHLIEGRDLKKRPTEFRIDEVLQPFNAEKFNFTKMRQEEVLFCFEQSESNKAEYFESAPMRASDSPNAIAINVSPIGYGHVLLIPQLLDCLPQRIDELSLSLAVYMIREAGDPYFRMGYNSLGAFATINHLHFQGYYLKEQLPIEKVATQPLATLASGVKISVLTDYPVRGLVFEGGSSTQELSDTVSKACILLQDENQPFNVLISNSGKRIFLLPQCFAQKVVLGEVSPEHLETKINPAVWELSGHIAMKRRKDFEEATEEKLTSFLVETSLSEKKFEDIKAQIFKVFS